MKGDRYRMLGYFNSHIFLCFTLKIYNYQPVNEDYNVVNTPAPNGMVLNFCYTLLVLI